MTLANVVSFTATVTKYVVINTSPRTSSLHITEAETEARIEQEARPRRNRDRDREREAGRMSGERSFWMSRT